MLGARGIGFPQRLGCRRAGDVPVHRQPVVVQHVDERDILGGRAEQREIAPQQRKRLAHERGRRTAPALRVLAEQQVGSREKTFQFGGAAGAQRAQARGGQPPEVVRHAVGQRGQGRIEFVERRVRRALRRAQHGEQRLFVTGAGATREGIGQCAQRRRRHRAPDERERIERRAGVQIRRALRTQRTEMFEENRRAGQLAQIVTRDGRAEIVERDAPDGRRRLGDDQRRGGRQLPREPGGRQPAGLREHRRGGRKRRYRVVATRKCVGGRRE
ncbi:hypothetical protein BAN20980_06854 [Burkholderia anthina]|uniref:Uncharacterized protein n=1 Tax=Burkholderia anthina TaxID=179879 RepID=A0A6P2GJR7_9BURK|nr:hypothetical protein BAN20980_06854 [Burkholderia anthina]